MIVQTHADMALMGRPFTFGLHLVADLYGCDIAKLNDREALTDFTEQVIKLIDMVPYGPCVAEHFGHADPITSGYTVYQLIETSNLSMHLSPFLGGAFLDIFSCKRFDPDVALSFAGEYFGASRAVVTLLER